MRIFIRTMLIAVVALLFHGYAPETFSQARIAGIVLEIRGPAEWRKNPKAKKSNKLDSTNQGRALHVGEQIRAGPTGRLRLYLCAGYKEISEADGWLTLSLAHECPNRRMLEAYGRVGGGSRGDSTQIFFPADHSVITPDLFKIKWTPSLAKCTLTLTIKEIEGRTLWEQENIDGELGLWDSQEARQKLKDYRASGDDAPLQLGLTDSCANRTEITFSIMSTSDEASLKAELANWSKKSRKLLIHLGRAFVFEKRRLISNAAEEYDAALKIAPQSRDLLVRTIIAHRATGNVAREEELKKRLPPGITIP